ncbi:thioredoxin-like protein YtpP [Oceanobacillus picturae]|jgi:thiol-disulfide isomerase/thioredoxin|uniref:Thioredoxin-like protein YtpP n=1 Tax=Oceanobacillus picturae TaxID=171693 RepID=W9AFB7_9BACI|nr:thioredoxin family protein [Oceanobacillus picturae]RIU89680.1 thioredoxin [Oceanobacillus picturae]GAQ19383.1 thioredoxin-like protein YtpP [Oceanobacillus picturae]CDO01582.1 Thioredoxin-like protein YtpP [Oceanobacillus picturae]
MKNLETVEQFNEWKNNENVIMYFTAGWCPDCVVIEPVLPEIEEEFPSFTFIKINRDNFIEICQEHDVYGIPSFLAFSNGKETGRFVSKDRKTKEEIVEFIQGLS